MWRKKPSWFEAQTVIAGLDPRLSGSFLLDRVHGVDSTPYRAFR
jgi:hypothetical protein